MDLEVITTGSGPDLVLLHGWGMHAVVWSVLIPVLASRFRVHAVNLPGYGRSASCDPYSLDAIADRLARCLPSRTMVCGWSLGGQVALTWARRARSQITRLGLLATTPSFVRRSDWAHGVEPEVLGEFATSLGDDHAGTLRRFLALQSLGDEGAREVAARLRKQLLAEVPPSVEALAGGLAILGTADLRASLTEVTQPVLLLHGARDRLVPPAAGEYLKAALPDARLQILAGAAHAPFISRPQETGNFLRDFFDA
jgi:pimeloyl-[acyl-carrier protein] methyl ester esterase